jgi:hypothetical protein
MMVALSQDSQPGLVGDLDLFQEIGNPFSG